MTSGPLLFLYASADSQYRRALSFGADQAMTCPTCDRTLHSAAATCEACNPWAAPASEESLGTAARTSSDPLAAAPPSERLIRLMTKNPPAPADLKRALRRSVLLWSAAAAYLVVCATALLMIAAGTAALVPLLGVFGTSIAFLATAQYLGNRTWLPRAVAVVGTRPDIGYHWFASSPQLARRSRILYRSMFMPIPFVIGWYVVWAAWPGFGTPQVVLVAVFLVAALIAILSGVVLEVRAAAVLRTDLACSPPRQHHQESIRRGP